MSDLLTAAQAAKRLGVTRRRVNAMISAGQLPAAWFGQMRVIRAADLAKVKDRRPGRPVTKTRKTRGK